jgi:hypothetical protein
MKILLILVLCLSTTFVHAQYRISGTVIDVDSNENLDFASVRLLTSDSTLVKGAIADNVGKFTLESISRGDYILLVSCLGYTNSYSNISGLNADMDTLIFFLRPSTVTLNTVTVQASQIIQKEDRQIILPTAMQKRVSNNGLNLLRNLQLPEIYIHPVSKTIESLHGGDVGIYLNGISASINDIIALNPNEIRRIEYHDSPGMRYNNAPSVIDFITVRRISGGVVSSDTNNALSDIAVSNNSVTTKYNYKKSEWGLIGAWSHRKVYWVRENEDSFVFPDHTIRRTEIGEPTKYKDHYLDMALNYNLIEPNKYILNIKLRNNFKDVPNDFSNRVGTVYSSDSGDPLSVSDLSTEYSNAPAIDIYYQQQLKNKQLLIFNAVGTYMNTKISRNYMEKTDQQTLYNIHSQVEGEKKSLITEGIYEKKYDKGKLTGGIKHVQSFTKNQYKGNVSALVNMNFAETYTYLEYLMNRNSFSYTFGIGATRTYNHQSDITQTKYTFHPKIGITYNIGNDFRVRYNANLSNNTPALSDMNGIEQVIDSFQIRRGNPGLYVNTSYNNNLTVFFHRGIFTVNLTGGYHYTDKPIMEYVLFENDKFIKIKENQKNNQRFFSNLGLNIRPVKSISINFSPGFGHYISNGNDYSHTYTNYYLNASILGNYKKWSFYADVRTRRNTLAGEIINRGERLHSMNIMYNADSWSIGLGMINPFETEYSQDSKNLSRLTPNYSKVASNDMARIIMLSFSWNINWGVKYDAGRRRMNNNDTDSGIMSGKRNSDSF